MSSDRFRVDAIPTPTSNTFIVTDRPYGAIADGDGSGGGTENGAAIQAVETAAGVFAAITGGATVYYPPGTYRCDIQIQYFANVKHIGWGARIDGTNCAASSLFWAEGTTGDEVDFATAGTRDDETIHAIGHGLAAGDYFLRKSSRYCLAYLVGPTVTIDCRLDFCLGETTVSTTGTYGADRPSQVKTVTDADNIVCNVPLEFQDFPITAIGSGLRSCSTIMKINWLKGVWWEGFEFIASSPMGSVMEVDWALEPQFHYLTFTMRAAVSRAHSMRFCLRGVRDHCTAEFTPGAAVSISQNTFYHNGTWDCTDIFWRVTNGWQAIDVTWSSEGHSPMNPRVLFGSAVNCINVLTFHPGVDGGEIAYNTANGCDQGISQRSPRVNTHHNTIVHAETTVSSRYGIILGPYARFCSTTFNKIEGYYLGIRDQIDGIIGLGPIEKCSDIDDNHLLRCVNPIAIQTNTTGAKTALGCRINVRRNRMDYPADTGISVGAYRNGLTIHDNRASNATGASFEMIDLAADTINNDVEGNKGYYNGASSTVLKALAITDTTTFPAATYPTNRLRNVNNVAIGNGKSTFIAGDQLVMNNADYTLLVHDAYCNNGLVISRGTSAKTFTVAPQADTPWMSNARMVVMQRDSGVLTIAGGSGVTIRSSGGALKLNGENAVAVLERTFEDFWVLYGNITT